MPEQPVRHETLCESRIGARRSRCDVGHRVHAHAGRHQRHVVDHRREDADGARDGEHFVDILVQPVGHVGQHAAGLQRAHGHQDAEEKENRRHVDVLEDFGYARLDRLLHVADAAFAVVDDFSQNPHESQRHHHAHVGRQSGEALEHRHEQQTYDAHDKDE